jgi:hypothetical protein
MRKIKLKEKSRINERDAHDEEGKKREGRKLTKKQNCPFFLSSRSDAKAGLYISLPIYVQ